MNYENLLCDEIKNIKPSGIRMFFDIVSEKKGVISLGIGEPDFATPYNVRKAGIESLTNKRTFYSPNAGFIELRQALCEYVEKKNDLKYYPKNQVLITVGGSEAIDAAIRALVNPGDEVIIPEPCFVCYEPITKMAHGVSVPIVTKEENNFRLTANELKQAITDKTKLLILPFPNNPTGAIMEKEHLEEIAKVLEGTDIIVLSDEIYSELTYGKKHVSIANISKDMYDRTVIVSGFSKTFAMTGWRLGYALGPEPIISAMTKLHQFAIMSAPTTAQDAAVEALRNCDDSVAEMKSEYNKRRKFLVSRLNQMGIDCFEPQGAFYVFPNISKFGLSSMEFCTRLLEEKNVAIIPGSAFGKSGEGFARISYAYSINKISDALDLIEDFIKGL